MKNKQIFKKNYSVADPKKFFGPGFNGDDEAKPKKFRELDLKKLSKRLLIYIGKSKIFLYYILGLVVLTALLNALKPAILGKIIDNLAQVFQTKVFDENGLLNLLFILVVISITAGMGQYAQGLFSARFTKQFITHLREDVFTAISDLPVSYTDKHSHGDLMSRLANDTDSVCQVLSQTIASFFSNMVSIITITSIMLYLSPLMTLLIYIFVPLSIFITKKLSKKMRYYFRCKHEAIGRLEGNIEENIYAYETLFAYNQRERATSKFNSINEEYRNYSIKSSVFSNLINPILSILSGLTYVIIALVGSILALKSIISIGTIQTFLLYIRQLTFPVNGIASQYAQIQSAFAAADRIFILLDENKEVENKSDALSDKDINKDMKTEVMQGDILINNLSFSYNQNTESEKQKVFEDFNLHVKKGEKVAIVGETGSGKTTIINMLMRFYPLLAGEILIDGKNINDYDLNFLRQNIALVLQDPFIFSGSVKDNICYGSGNFNQEEIIFAAKSANAHEFIMQLPNAYDTLIGEEGSSLSAGQKQLICLARTFIKNAPILILDEATANIDTLTEQHIQDAILKLMKQKTCIVIAHRLSTIINMDRIIVLDKGKIVESAKHEELLAKKGSYYNLYTN